MAYEVTKQVGKRAYRYRVESYRDPESQRVRSRWTYLGVLGAQPTTSVKRRAVEQTRQRLIDAFEELAADVPYASLTAGAVAKHARVAHGTFYRYFSDKRALLLAAIEQLGREVDATRPNFSSAIGTREEERARVRAWTLAVFAKPGKRYGTLRAYVESTETDDEMRAFRSSRAADRRASLATYLQRLRAAGIAQIQHPDALAAALTLLVDAAFRDLLAHAKRESSASPALGLGVTETFDRAIFAER